MGSSTRWGRGVRYHDAERGRTMLLNVAIGCLAKKGFRSTTMQDVAEAAHVSRRTVYRYFSDKREMVREVVDYSHDIAFHAMDEAAREYDHDFFEYFEMAVVAGVRFYLDMDLEVDSALTRYGKEVRDFLEHKGLVDRWVSLLREPYANYINKHPEAKDRDRLENYAELATLLVTGHCHLRSSEKSVRDSFNNMMALASSVHGGSDKG